MANLYDILHISPSASQAVVTENYLALKKAADTNSQDSTILDFSYSILGDISKRQAYDFGLFETSKLPDPYQVTLPADASEKIDDAFDNSKVQQKEDASDVGVTPAKTNNPQKKSSWLHWPPPIYFIKDIHWWAWPLIFLSGFIWMIVQDSNPVEFFLFGLLYWCIWKVAHWKNENIS